MTPEEEAYEEDFQWRLRFIAEWHARRHYDDIRHAFPVHFRISPRRVEEMAYTGIPSLTARSQVNLTKDRGCAPGWATFYPKPDGGKVSQLDAYRDPGLTEVKREEERIARLTGRSLARADWG